MKKALLILVLSVSIIQVANAQFISPMRSSTKSIEKKFRVLKKDVRERSEKGFIDPNTDKMDSVATKDSVVFDTAAFQRQLLIGGLDNEGIAIVDLKTGRIGQNGKLTLSAAIAKTDTATKTDIKTLLQAGGNFIVSYSTPIKFLTSKSDSSEFSCYGLFKTKLGLVLPAIGTSTNIIEAHIDPGFEFGFKIHTSGNELVIVGGGRLGFVWATKDFSDKVGLTNNFFPYFHITGGFEIPKFGQIVYSQHFVSKSVFAGTAPKASIGISLPIN